MAATADLQSLGMTLEAMYEAISFPEDGEPDWDRIKETFHPAARLTRITPEGVERFDLDSFRAMVTEMLDRGVYTCFYEREIVRTVQMFGSLAHVLSAYEIKRSLDAASHLARGINSIQLIRSGSAWKIHSLLWDEEAADIRLDLPHLFGSRAG